jgi:hypothetical protein
MHKTAEHLASNAVAAGGGLAGGILGAAFAVTAVLRRSKPLHPAGAVAAAVLAVEPPVEASGSPLLDEPGEYDCLVRASWAVGSGPERSDIEGFAVRVRHGAGGSELADVLFASTGDGATSRFVLTVRQPGVHGVQTTLLPVRAGDHGLVLRLEPMAEEGDGPWPSAYELSWAHGRGRWHRFARLDVAWHGTVDPPERFDPIAHPLPGTTQYPVVAGLREPSYLLSRLSRPSAGRLPEGSGR